MCRRKDRSMSNEELYQRVEAWAEKRDAELYEKHGVGAVIRQFTSAITENRAAIEECGVEGFVRRIVLVKPWMEKFGESRMAEEVLDVLEETHGQPASEPLELEEGATLEDMEEARIERLLEETVLMQTVDIDNDTILDIDRQVVERLKLFYSFEDNYRLLRAAINHEYKEFCEELEDKDAPELLEQVLRDPGLRDNQRVAVFEILELLKEYVEEVDRWQREEGLDQLAALERLDRLLAPGEKAQRREARRELRKAKRKGKKRWEA
jgi:hypothetical protein